MKITVEWCTVEWFVFCRETLVMNSFSSVGTVCGRDEHFWIAHHSASIFGCIYFWLIPLKLVRMCMDIYVEMLWIQRKVVEYVKSLEASKNWLNWTFARCSLYSWSSCSWSCLRMGCMNFSDFSRFFPVMIFMIQRHTRHPLFPLERWILSILEKQKSACADLQLQN